MVVSGQLHAPSHLPYSKEPLYPLNRKLGRLPSHSGHFWSSSNCQNREQLLESFKILAVLGTEEVIKYNFCFRSNRTYILVQLSD